MLTELSAALTFVTNCRLGLSVPLSSYQPSEGTEPYLCHRT